MNYNVNQLYQIYENTSKLVQRRGYEFMIPLLSNEEFSSQLNENNYFSIYGYSKKNKKYICACILLDGDSVKSGSLKTHLKEIHNEFMGELKTLNHLAPLYGQTEQIGFQDETTEELLKDETLMYVCILPSMPSSSLVKKYSHGVQLIEQRKFIFDILNHIYQPKEITLLTENEKQQVLNDLQTKEKGFPKISKTEDPLVMYFNAKIGQMFRFKRMTLNQTEQTYYRVVSI